MNQCLLVTGGCGFIGSNFVRFVLQHRPDYTVHNLDNRLRIACLGDSVTFGHMVEYTDSYPAMLEKRFAELGHRVEVFNFALPGWSTRQQRIAYQVMVRKYRPDYVILSFCLNDVAEMQNNLSQPPQAAAWIYQNSNLVRSVLQLEAREIGRVEELFDSPTARHVRHGWQLCHQEIRSLARDVEQDGGKLVLLVFPFRFQVEPDAPSPIAQQNLTDFASEQGMGIIDVLPAFRKLGPEAFMDYDHLSQTGAALVVSEILRSGRIRVDARRVR